MGTPCSSLAGSPAVRRFADRLSIECDRLEVALERRRQSKTRDNE